MSTHPAVLVVLVVLVVVDVEIKAERRKAHETKEGVGKKLSFAL